MGARWSSSWWLALVSLAYACNPRVAACPQAMEPTPIVEEAAPPPSPPEKTLCWAKGKPHALAKAIVPKESHCRAFNEVLLLKAEARVRRDTAITFKPSRLYVDVQCDPTTGVLHELVYEDGDSRSGALRIVWLREIEGGDWNVHVIESTHARGQRRVELKAGTLAALELRTPVDAARIALHVRPNLVALSSKVSASGSMSASGSSKYLRMTVEDEDGHIADRVFAGLDQSGTQRERLPIIAAIDAIDEALAKPKNKLVPIEETDEDRAMFQRRLALALALPPGEPWVKERYVNLATTFGTVDAIPLLVPLLAPLIATSARKLAEPDTTDATDKDATPAKDAPAGDEAVRESALDAIAAITTWNPRVAPDGKERSTADAAAAATDECTLPVIEPTMTATSP